MDVREGHASTYTQRLGPGARLQGGATQDYYFRPFRCGTTMGASRSGTNAFGATMEVADERTQVLGVGQALKYGTGEWRRKLPPNAARALSRSLVVRLSGVLGAWGPDGTLGCTRAVFEPTFSSPVRSDTLNCIFKADALRTDLVDARTGEVLWTAGPPEARKPRR